MKTVQFRIFVGVLVAGLLCSRAPLQAQPASKPVPTDSEANSTDVKADPIDDEADSDDDEADSDDDGADSTDDTIVIDDDSKPWSQGVSAENRKAARKLFLEGNRFFRLPLFTKAAEQYTAALSKWKHPAFYFNLAIAQLNLGKEVEARENLERALQHGKEALGAAQFQEAQKQLKEVERQLGRIRVSCRTPGAEVTLDGVALFTGPGSYEGWVKAKSHEITAKKAGYLSEARQVTISSGELQKVELKMITLSEAADATRRWAAWKPWAVVAAGGAITVAGGAFHAFAFRNFSGYDDDFQGLPCASEPPATPPGCTEMDTGSKLNAQLERAKKQQTIAIGAYIAGGSLVAAGVVLLYLNRPQLMEQGVPGSSFRSMNVTPMMSADMFGVLVSVSR